MDSGCRLVFDPTPSRHHRGGHMLLLGRTPNPIFQASNKRRLPFFTSSDDYDLLEEDYYDEQTPEKKRRLTPEQVQMLEVSFDSDNKLEPERKSELAKKLGLQPRQVAVWFQNRRARWRTKQLERDFDRIKASHDALLAENGSLRMDNNMLRSQVLALTEKIKSENAGTVGVMGDDQAGEQQPETVVERNSVESYFQESFHGGCGMGIQSEEDDGSDEGCSYLPADVFEVGQNNDVGLWVWS